MGEIVKNAVPINALNNKANDVSGTYAMAAYTYGDDGREFIAILTVEERTGEITGIVTDSIHSVSGRNKKPARLTRSHREFTLSTLVQ